MCCGGNIGIIRVTYTKHISTCLTFHPVLHFNFCYCFPRRPSGLQTSDCWVHTVLLLSHQLHNSSASCLFYRLNLLAPLSSALVPTTLRRPNLALQPADLDPHLGPIPSSLCFRRPAFFNQLTSTYFTQLRSTYPLQPPSINLHSSLYFR